MTTTKQRTAPTFACAAARRLAGVGVVLAAAGMWSGAALAADHPVLLSPANQVDVLAAGGSAWTSLRSQCDSELDQLITPGYAGWDWRYALERYSLAYLVAKRIDTTRAAKYGKKALALMTVLARQHNYGTPENATFVGLGDGATTSFTLPFTPAHPAQVKVLTTTITTVPLTYSGSTTVMPNWGLITAIADTAGGPSAYPTSDWQFSYRDGGDALILRWLGSHHPANGATYSVRITTAGNDTATTLSGTTVSGTTVTLASAPAVGKAVFVRYIGTNYEQTGNLIGGRNSVQPDGPGYPMRSFAVALAYGFDLIHDLPEFTNDLKQEFVGILNSELDWYHDYGYERDGDIGNYFIRGYLTSTLNVGWGTAGDNPRAAEWQTLGETLLQRTYDGITHKLPGGYGPQGTYAIGTTSDCLQLFSFWRDLTGHDLLPTLSWTDHLIPANIYGTKPDRATFYDGGDWSDVMPPAAPFEIGQSFLTYLPNHAQAPYARQWLADLGHPSSDGGTVTDYKSTFPLTYVAATTGPLYTRSDWSTSAVWLALAAGPIVVDHQHRDQGHVELQRGADPLLVDAGGYDASDTTWHNSLLVDDRGHGDAVVYPPNQGDWGDDVGITRSRDANGTVYGQADLTTAWASPYGTNAVQRAIRSVLFVRPDLVVVHDAVRVGNSGTAVGICWNFAANPTRSGNIFTSTMGASRLFMQPLLPATVAPTWSTLTYDARDSYHYEQYSPSGTADRAFLHVFEAVGSGQASMRANALVSSGDGSAEGVEASAGGSNRVLLFATHGQELTAFPLTYAYSIDGAQAHLLTDVHPESQFHVVAAHGGSTVYDATLTSSSAGTLEIPFSAAAGTVTITSFGSGDTTPPTIDTAAHGPATITGTTADLAVVASDDTSTDSLLYHWVLSTGSGVSFSPNSTHLAASTTATFTHAGSYKATVTVTDAVGNHSASTTATLTVQQTPSTVAISESAPTVASAATITLHASVADQFGTAMSGQTITWSLITGSGSITTGGVFTAPTLGSDGSSGLRATSGGHTANVTVHITGTGGSTGSGSSSGSGSTTSGSTTSGGTTGGNSGGGSGGCGAGSSLGLLAVTALAGLWTAHRRNRRNS